MIENKRYREIIGIVTVLTAIIVLLSLFTYSKFDYNNLISNQPIKNTIGPLGAYLSHSIRSAFGIASYLLILIILQMGKSFFEKGTLKDSIDKIFSILFLMITLSSLIAIFSIQHPQTSSGYLGIYIYSFLKSFSGSVGAYLIIAIVNLVGLILIGFVSLSSLFNNNSDIDSNENVVQNKVNTIKQKISTHSINFPFFTFEERNYKSKKMPWITKESIDISEKVQNELAEKKIPLFLNMDIPEEPHKKENFTNIIIPQVDNPQLEDLFTNSEFEEIEVVYPENKQNEIVNNNATITDNNKINVEEINLQKVDENIESNSVDESEFNNLENNEMPITEISPISTFQKELLTESENSIRITDISLVDEKEEILEAIPVINSEIIQPKETVSEIHSINQTTIKNDTKSINEEINNEEAKIEPNSTNLDEAENNDILTNFLNVSKPTDTLSHQEEIKRNSYLLVKTLDDFGISSKVLDVNRGPVITLYELEIASGIRVNKVANLSDDIAMALAASRVRILAPIPGKSAVGIEIPNGKRESVTLGDIINSTEFQSISAKLKVVLGKDILGKPVTLDLNKQPHILIAGATGSGKSVCVNTLISSLIHTYTSDYLKFIMVDPKMVELQLYNGLPHLLTPVITDPKLAPSALKWAIYEMERRYKVLSEVKKRDIESYNKFLDDKKRPSDKLPFIVIIIDELADLMMVAPKEMEGYITRIAQKARAIGIHMVLATQRPSVDIITGIIKANFPARIAFQVAQRTDSRTILDQSGAEKLLGQGDMLYQSPTSSFPTRIQGAFVSEDEIEKTVNHLSSLGTPHYIDILESVSKTEELEIEDLGDELFVDAMKIIEETRKASASYLQRRLSIGYNRAARIIELMEDKGYVGPPQGSKPREVYI